MRVKESKWYECKAIYDSVADDGKKRRVTEAVVVEADSFAEAERLVMEEVGTCCAECFEVVDVKICKFKDVLIKDCTAGATHFFKVRVEYIVLDERTGKEKRHGSTLLVEAEDLDDAVKCVEEAMRGTMSDYEKVHVGETRISGIIEK